VLGAALAVRRTAFEAVDGFDPSFFLYFEEVDLCARLRARGWEVHFTPGATIVHLGSASTAAIRQWAAVQHFHSNLRYYRRHLRGISLPLWIGIMRTKMAFRLVRDSASWVLEPSESRRARLWEDVGTWREALRQTGR
jgi:GT2 family glycosyltransferase